MIKRLFFCLSLVFVLFACSDSDKPLLPAPEITEVLVNGAKIESSMSLEIGESAHFTVRLANDMDVNYSWLQDDKEVSTDKEFTFKAEKLGQYRFTLVLTNLDKVTTNKDLGTIYVISPTPVIKNLFSDGEPIVKELMVSAESKLVFTAEVEKAANASYFWILNGDTLQNKNALTLDYDLGLSGVLRFAAVNSENISATKDIVLEGPYLKGSFIYGTTATGLSFIHENGKEEVDNLFMQINKGVNLGSEGINDMQIFKNKLYILSPTISYADRRAQIVVADAQTLKLIEIITAKGFSSTELGSIYNMTIVDDEKAYIGSNDIKAGNISSVKVLDLKKKILEVAPISGTSGELGTVGPAWARMLSLSGHTMIACGSKIQVVDHATDLVVKTLDFAAGQVVDVVMAKNKKIYALVNAKSDSESSFFAEIDPLTFASDIKIPATHNGSNIRFKGGQMANARTAVSPVSSELFFTVAGSNPWSSNPNIYKFNYDTKIVSLFVDVNDVASASGINGYMGVDGTGKLIVPLSGEWSYTNEEIIALDIVNGKLLRNDYKSISGEGNVLTTWSAQ